MTAPPPAIDCARVLRFANVDNSVQYVGNSTLFVDGKLLGPVPCLAICKYRGEDEVLLMHCDHRWNSQGVSSHGTIAEAMARAEKSYKGISAKWIDAGASEEVAEKYLDELFGDQVCSFCGRRPDQVRQLYGAEKAHICDECVEKFYTMLVAEELPPRRSK